MKRELFEEPDGGAAGFLVMACVGASELVPRIRAAATLRICAAVFTALAAGSLIWQLAA